MLLELGVNFGTVPGMAEKVGLGTPPAPLPWTLSSVLLTWARPEQPGNR